MSGKKPAAEIIRELFSVLGEEEKKLVEDEKARRPKTRKKPKLLKPGGKRHLQQRVEGMVFDSASGKWVGNEDAVRSFPGSASPRRPALIKTTQGSASKPQERSGMRWDPRRMMWDGNEADTARFDKHKPALISGQGVMTPQAIAKLIPGHNMRYDAERQTWVGNDEDADVFKDVQMDVVDTTPRTRTEFILSDEMIRNFRRAAEKHDAQLRGWAVHPEFAKNRQAHASVIRSMSLERVIRDFTSGSTVQAQRAAASPSPVLSPPADQHATSSDDSSSHGGPARSRKKPKAPEDFSHDFRSESRGPLVPKAIPEKDIMLEFPDESPTPSKKPSGPPSGTTPVPMEVTELCGLEKMTSDQLAKRLLAKTKQPQPADTLDELQLSGDEKPASPAAAVATAASAAAGASFPDAIDLSSDEEAERERRTPEAEIWPEVAMPESLPAFKGIHSSADFGADEDIRGLVMQQDQKLQVKTAQPTPTEIRRPRSSSRTPQPTFMATASSPTEDMSTGLVVPNGGLKIKQFK